MPRENPLKGSIPGLMSPPLTDEDVACPKCAAEAFTVHVTQVFGVTKPEDYFIAPDSSERKFLVTCSACFFSIPPDFAEYALIVNTVKPYFGD